MRKVAISAAVGGLPGMLIILVPLLLHQLGIITADQSQIGFIGVPLLFLGVFVGAVGGASESGQVGRVMLGVAVGFVAGLGVGVLIDQALIPAGSEIAGTWLLLAPAAMIGGGALGMWWGERTAPPGKNRSEEDQLVH